MIRTGTAYLNSIRDDRAVHMAGQRVADVAAHPAFKPLVDLRARLYDLQHEPATQDVLTTEGPGGRNAIAAALPYAQADWWAKRRATDLVLDQAGGIVTRIGDETAGEMWSLLDAAEALATIDPTFAPNLRTHVARAVTEDRFQVTGTAEPHSAPGTGLQVVRETDAGLVVSGAKYETAAPYANLAFVKPTVSDWGDQATSPFAVGFISDLSAKGLTFLCRSGFAARTPPEDYPLTHRLDEIDTLVIFDNVLVPWENVLFYRHTRAARVVRATLHRYSAFAFLQHSLKFADMLIGAALLNLRQAGLDRLQAVQDKLATLAVWREGIEAHLTAAVALAERSPAGLMMPHQSLLYCGRELALSQMPQMMQLARELCGAQIALIPDAASFRAPETAPWLDTGLRGHDEWLAEDRRKLMAFARDLLNSDHAGHQLTFQLFAQGPPHIRTAAVYHAFDWDGPMDFVRRAAGLSPAVAGPATRIRGDSPLSRWFATELPQASAAR